MRTLTMDDLKHYGNHFAKIMKVDIADGYHWTAFQFLNSGSELSEELQDFCEEWADEERAKEIFERISQREEEVDNEPQVSED